MTTSTKVSELRSIAAKIDAKRIDLGISKNQFCQKFGQLGSTKTYGRILDASDPLDQLDVAGQLDNYIAAWELVQTWSEDPEETRIYSDFEHIRDAVLTVREALDEPGISRLVLITGASGAGKSTFLDLLEQSKATANITYRVEATEAWRESTNELLGALLTEVGVFDRSPVEDGEAKSKDSQRALPCGPGARLRKLVERLDSRKVILAIDESHHIGPAGYNIVKTLINQTRAAVVMTAIPDLIQRINRSSHVEAAQLFFNRLYKHIRFGTPEAGDVIEFMKRRGIKFASSADASAIARKIATDSEGHGMWKFVARCSREGRRLQAPINSELAAKILTSVKRSISLG